MYLQVQFLLRTQDFFFVLRSCHVDKYFYCILLAKLHVVCGLYVHSYTRYFPFGLWAKVRSAMAMK